MTENIEVLTHSSIRITDGGRRIYADPYEMREAPHDADVIFVTHEHYDHFSPEDIEKAAKPDTVLVVPESMKKKAKEVKKIVGEIVTVAPGEQTVMAGIGVEAVPAYNIGKHFHPQSAGWVGYVLTFGGERIYIAGDTDVTDEARLVKCDVALVPVGGTYTMDKTEAAALVNEIRPGVAIPTHYGTVVGLPADGEAFAALVDSQIRGEVKMR